MINTTNIVCSTGRVVGTNLVASVHVFVDGRGDAVGSVQYQYIDLWSSLWTWGGRAPPEEGTIVSIERGVTIFLDVSTPILKALVIDNATLIFDDHQDLQLNAEYILLIRGGRLQIGTALQPFQHQAIINLYGDLRSTELPICKKITTTCVPLSTSSSVSLLDGAKVLAVREGTLDLHGRPTVKTWTRLNSTAVNGSSLITLVDPVDWPINSEIIIATTGDRTDQKQCEQRRILNISSDGRQLTLDEPLTYTHLGRTQRFNRTIIEIRAEVGLLSHNVIIRGTAHS